MSSRDDSLGLRNLSPEEAVERTYDVAEEEALRAEDNIPQLRELLDNLDDLSETEDHYDELLYRWAEDMAAQNEIISTYNDIVEEAGGGENYHIHIHQDGGIWTPSRRHVLGGIIAALLGYDATNTAGTDHNCGDEFDLPVIGPLRAGRFDIDGAGLTDQEVCSDEKGGVSTGEGKNTDVSGSRDWEPVVNSLETTDANRYVEDDSEVYEVGQHYLSNPDLGLSGSISEDQVNVVELLGQEITDNVIPDEQSGGNTGRNYTLEFFNGSSNPEYDLGNGGIIRLSDYEGNVPVFGVFENQEVYEEARNDALEIRGG